MTPATTPRPNVRGQLAATSLPELLVMALDRKLNGSLVFKAPSSGKSALFLDDGRVTKVRTAEPVEPLGRLLVTSGTIDRATLEAGLYLAARHHDRLGVCLMQLHALGPEALEASLGEQLARRVAWLGGLHPASIFGFYAGIDFLEERPAAALDPLALIWRCVRESGSDHPRRDGLLSTLRDHPLRLHAQATPERFALSPDEQATLDVMRSRPQPLAALTQTSKVDAERMRRLVYALALTRHLDLGRDKRPVESVPPPKTLLSAPPSSAAPATAPAPRSGVPSSTVPSIPQPRRSAISSASISSAARPALPPPPRSARAQMPPASERVERALERGARSIRPELDPGRAEDAARAYQAAQECVGRKQFARAEIFAGQACEADPQSAEYLALHAWLRVQRGELSQPMRATQIMALLDRAVMKERESVSIRFYRAQALKRLGRDAEAYRDFRFVARRQPDHLDAVREVRLHEMRARNEERKKSSVFSKLFLR